VAGPSTRSICRNKIPKNAVKTDSQLVSFEYSLHVQASANVALVIQAIELTLAQHLAGEFLSCSFSGDGQHQQKFYTHDFNSLPLDKIVATSTCTETTNITSGIECYTIGAAFVATIFYLPAFSHRNLAGSISDANVLDNFAKFLTKAFVSGIFDSPGLVRTKFVGITNAAHSTRNTITFAVIGSLAAASVVLLFLAAIVVVLHRRRKVQSTSQPKKTFRERAEDSATGDKSTGHSIEDFPAPDDADESQLPQVYKMSYASGEDDSMMSGFSNRTGLQSLHSPLSSRVPILFSRGNNDLGKRVGSFDLASGYGGSFDEVWSERSFDVKITKGI
jgi:hypothetical protein